MLSSAWTVVSKAEKALDALKGMSAPHARVIRDGVETVIDAADLVPGDIIRLEAGDFVPADARLLDLRCSPGGRRKRGVRLHPPHAVSPTWKECRGTVERHQICVEKSLGAFPKERTHPTQNRTGVMGRLSRPHVGRKQSAHPANREL